MTIRGLTGLSFWPKPGPGRQKQINEMLSGVLSPEISVHLFKFAILYDIPTRAKKKQRKSFHQHICIYS